MLLLRLPPRSTLGRSSAASDGYKRQVPGSAEQARVAKLGFEMGAMPNAESGFMFVDGKQVVMPGGKEARAQRDKFVEPIRKEEVKFNTADIAFKNAKDFVASPSGGSDTALIYNFFTTLDLYSSDVVD